MKKILLFILALSLLIGCDSKDKNQNNTIVKDEIIEEVIDIEEDINEEDRYFNYLKETIAISDVDQISLFIKTEQNNYIILGVGQPAEDGMTSIDRVFVLSEEPTIVLIDEIEHDYFIEEVKVIKLEGSEKDYIYCGLTNSVNLYGFVIYSLVDEELLELAKDVSATGAGFSELFDNEDDGYINGYTSNRWSYDVLYHETFKTYLWDKNSFELSYHSVDVGEYPVDSMDVVSYFIELQSINDSSIDIENRLKEIFPSRGYYNGNIIDFEDILSSNLGMETFILYSKESIDDVLYIIVTNGNESTSEAYKYIFKMYEEFGKWHIMNIELEKL